MPKFLQDDSANQAQLEWLRNNYIFDKDSSVPTAKRNPARSKPHQRPKKQVSFSIGIIADSEIDLHGLLLEEALCKIEMELKLAQKNKWKCIRIIHGIGKESGGVIRKFLERKFRSEWSCFVSDYRYERNNRGSSLAILV
ncbi:hypothetical protein AGMMS49938_15950 [Fibrobacterales bacterium]|nr:hypothetical protein AGMMS49938_15950 [Fibrobacterales bacterium]